MSYIKDKHWYAVEKIIDDLNMRYKIRNLKGEYLIIDTKGGDILVCTCYSETVAENVKKALEYFNDQFQQGVI